MIVRQTKQIPINHVYGVGGGVALLVMAILAARANFVPTVTPSCEQRYMSGVRFSFARQTGEPLTAAELQGKLAGLDWGLNENVRMRKVEAGPAPVVLEVALPTPHVAGSEARDKGRSGMGFVWKPKALSTATAGCLSYSVWVPADFHYGSGGVLPGLTGDETTVAATDTTEERQTKPFSTRIHWRNDGTLESAPATQQWNQTKLLPFNVPDLLLERGKWTKIDQEIQLNAPGESDGFLRVWINGVLALETAELELRGDAAQTMSAVNVEVHFANDKLQWAAATKSSRLQLTPIELRLK